MSTNDDPRRSIAAWLAAEAPDRARTRLIETSRERVRTTRQRPAWSPTRRTSDMNSFAKLAIAAAAVVVVALVGYNLLPNRGGVGGVPASPSPSISPAPTPTSLVTDAVADGLLEPGTYTYYSVDGLPVGVRFTVPDGWSWVAENKILSTGDPADEIAITLWTGPGLQVYTDPCQWSGAEPAPPTGPTARDAAEALSVQPTRNGSAPIQRDAPAPDGVDPWPGWLVDVTVPQDIDFATCDRGEFRSWGPDDVARYHQGPGQHDSVWFVDVESTRLVIDATYLPSAPQESIDEIDAIRDSMVIGQFGGSY